MSIFSYIHRIKKIQKNLGATCFFSASEITSNIINLWDAKKRLSQQEYFYVCVIYETYQKINDKICLDYMGFMGVCNDIIAHFDLVAPYYKYCGNDKLNLERYLDEEKKAYRQRALVLLNGKQLFNENWMKLHKEFMEKFY